MGAARINPVDHAFSVVVLRDCIGKVKKNSKKLRRDDEFYQENLDLNDTLIAELEGTIALLTGEVLD